MRHRSSGERRCTYLVVLENASASVEALRDLASYLSSLAVSSFEVVILDTSAPAAFEENRRVLRWVSTHVPVRIRHLTPTGTIDPIRAALDVASCEKVIVADSQVRYGQEALDHLCAQLDLHELVEPQDYFDPLPWWGGIEAGRTLVRRGIGPMPARSSTFGFRKRAVRGLRSIDSVTAPDDPVRRLMSQGAEVFSANEIFVRRIPPRLDDWLRDRPRDADQTAVFFGLLPLTLLVAILGGLPLAGVCVSAIAICAFGLAMRGRIGAGPFFPMRACLYAPLWLLERSFGVYWALFLRVTGTSEPPRVRIVVGGERVATGVSSPTANTR
jgi:hypothetical protein